MAGLKLIEDLEKTLYLFNLSDIHKTCSISDIQAWVIPPLKLKQYRLYEDKDIPLCYVSWAFLDAETMNRYINNTFTLTDKDWNKGKSLWLTNIVAPLGGAIKALVRIDEERKKAFTGQRMIGDGGGKEAGKDFSNIFYRRMNKEKDGNKIFKSTKRID